MIDERLISEIEKALGFKFYEVQKMMLKGMNLCRVGRRCCSTMVYIIKLALSDGDPIKRRDFRYYTDRHHKEIN